MELSEIMELLPHRYPFLLVDRILELESGKRAVGLKNVTCNEPFFQGHFPGWPVMPGVLLLEAMAQVGAVALLALPNNQGKLGLLGGVNKARFRRRVIPGDVLRIETAIIKSRSGVGHGEARITVDGERVAEAELLFALVPAKGAGGEREDRKQESLK